MKTTYSLLVFFIGLVAISCGNVPKVQEKLTKNAIIDSNEVVKKFISDKVFTYLTKVSNENYRLEILTTCMDDSLSKEGVMFPEFKPIVLGQELFFYLGDSLIKRIKHPSRKIKIKKYDMEEIEITEDVIMDIASIIGENGFFYYVTGYGGCNTCSEYFAFYRNDGELLWSSYSSLKDKFTEEKGDYEKTLTQYKIPKTAFDPDGIKMVWVYPVKNAQKESNDRLIRIESVD
jgi:hypothetical protein